MSEKFTYIDFLMYVIPGAFLASAILLAVFIYSPDTSSCLESDLISGIAFLVFSFVVGNFLQVHSHRGPENRLKTEYWNGYYPSQAMFFPQNKILNEKERQDLIAACVQTGIMSPGDLESFKSKELNNEGTAVANKCFNYMRVYLADQNKGSRIQGAEGYFLFFRGLFVASFWAAMVMLIIFLLNLAKVNWPQLDPFFGDPPTLLLGLVVPLICTVVFLVFWRSFRYRCRGAAQGFAREVYRAYCANMLIKENQ